MTYTTNKIKEIRSALGWTQLELAERVGAAQAEIHYLEAGKRQLTEQWIDRLCAALNCNSEELLGKGNPESKLSHLDDKGAARMVDVSDKAVTERTAIAEGFVAMKAETLTLIETGETKKGDVIAAARIAGIMAAKKTHELIPLCHPLALTKATIDFEPQQKPAGIKITALVKVSGQTGVEMEALTAVSVAALTIYDMLKAADKGMEISAIRLIEKTGGRSGTYKAP